MNFDSQTHTQSAQGMFWAGRLLFTVMQQAARVRKTLADRRSARELYKWSEHDLKDIGVSRADVDREAMKPVHFWE